MNFEKTMGWMDWFAGSSKPQFKVPVGSVDAHCHVFGPGAEFPFAPERKYTPCDASKAQLFALRDHLGFASQVGSADLGVASATKMCRSVMIKGLEAMVMESLTAARHYGVEDADVASLDETFPGIDWEIPAAYFFQRVIEHGRRRSEEVREVAATMAVAGLTPWSAQGTADRQAWVADLADAGLFGSKGSPTFARSPDWRTEADRMLAHLQLKDASP